MNHLDYLTQLAVNGRAIAQLVEGVSAEQARWKPAADEWSILEVINHLYDEEQLDFRFRIGLLLQDPEQDWPPNDPNGWVTERRYNERDLAQSVANFISEREKSLQWLENLGEVEWSIGKKAPWGGILTAGDLFASWIAHDYLHIRQLNELKRAYAIKQLAPFDSGYAGEW